MNTFQSEMDNYWDSPGGPVVGTSPSSAGGAGWIPGRGAGIPHASQPKNQSMKQRQYCNKFNKNFKKKKKKRTTIYQPSPPSTQTKNRVLRSENF